MPLSLNQPFLRSVLRHLTLFQPFLEVFAGLALDQLLKGLDFSPENSRTTIKRTLFFCCLLFSIGYLHRVAGQTIAHRQRSPATNLQKPVNYRLACKSYFLNFLEKSRCFRCRR
jgi:hypothetical protein